MPLEPPGGSWWLAATSLLLRAEPVGKVKLVEYEQWGKERSVGVAAK
jgi:hypothetical protein